MMCAIGFYWWILPLFFFGMMVLCAVFFRSRRGGWFCCSPWNYGYPVRDRIQALEDEIDRLKKQKEVR